MVVKEYWKEIGAVLALIIILSGGVGTYALVKTSSYDICTAKIDGITTRAAWRPTALPHRYMCELELKGSGKPNTQWCWDLVDYGGVTDARCNKYEQIEYNSPDLGTGELTGYDLIKFEEYPVSYKCSEPLVEMFDERRKENYMGCNASIIVDETTTDKSALARELAPEGLTYEELNQKVGGYNHYRYGFTTFEICNPFSSSLDLVSSLGAVFPDLPIKDFKLMKEDQYGRWDYYTPSSKLIASDGCEKFGITIQKNKDGERIEYGTKVSKDGIDYINHPFWDGADGDQSHITMVPDGKYFDENWEDWATGTKDGDLTLYDVTFANGWSNFTITEVSGNKYLNVTSTANTGYKYLISKAGLFTSLGNNFTMYYKVNSKVAPSSDYHAIGSGWRSGINPNDVIKFDTGGAASEGVYGWYASGYHPRTRFDISYGTWYYIAFNQTMNASNDGANNWLGADDDGSGDWDLGTNTTLNGVGYSAANYLKLMTDAGVNPADFAWDNIFMATIPDGDYPDTITNLTCPFLYSDAGNTPCKNVTIFFYKDGSLDTTLTSTNCNRTERSLTIPIGSGDAGTYFCNASACDTGEECDNTPKSNQITIYATNQPPVVDYIKLDNSSGWYSDTDPYDWSVGVTDTDSGDTITLHTQVYYPNGTTINTSIVSWTSDGLISIQNFSISNAESEFTQGNTQFSINATANDATAWAYLDNATQLWNYNPVASAVTIASDDNNKPDANITLTGVTFDDQDTGDTWNTNSSKWFVDGVEITSGQNNSILFHGNFSAGEVVNLSIAVQDDNGGWSLFNNSNSLTINSPTIINYVLAQMNATTTYKSPELFNWFDNMTSLRVNCTDADASQPTGVHINLTDRTGTLRCDGDAVQSGDLWTYICPKNETINRSSDWYFRASCTDGITTITNTTYWDIPWGTILNVTVDYPSTNIDVKQNSSFPYYGGGYIDGGEAINVSIAIDPFNQEIIVTTNSERKTYPILGHQLNEVK